MNTSEKITRLARDRDGWFVNSHGFTQADCIYRVALENKTLVGKISNIGGIVNDKLKEGKKFADDAGLKTSHIIEAQFYLDKRGDAWIQGAFTAYGEGAPELMWGLS